MSVALLPPEKPPNLLLSCITPFLYNSFSTLQLLYKIPHTTTKGGGGGGREKGENNKNRNNKSSSENSAEHALNEEQLRVR